MFSKKVAIIVLIFSFSAGVSLFPQNNEKKFIPFAEIFTNFHFAPADNSVKPGFDVTRAWFGGDFTAGDRFKG